MSVGRYLPSTLNVPCPTHGLRRFEMDHLRDTYICPDREEWDAPTIIASTAPPEQRDLVVRPEGPRHLQVRLKDAILLGGCFWVVPVELLWDNPDGADPIRMGKLALDHMLKEDG